MSVEQDLLTSARTIAYRVAGQIEDARRKEAGDIANATATHTSMAQDYWHPRWKLEKKLDALRRLIAVFEEET